MKHIKTIDDLNHLEDGMNFTARIEGCDCSGILSIEHDVIYLCQNIKEGNNCRDRKGFDYSWMIFDYNYKRISGPDYYRVHNLMVEVDTLSVVEYANEKEDEILLLL